jgi:hypothetical protein
MILLKSTRLNLAARRNDSSVADSSSAVNPSGLEC